MSDAPCIPLLYERAVHFDTRLCVGLDPIPDLIPEILYSDPDPAMTFCMTIIDATEDVALAYKPNIAFFESAGAEGFERLEALIAHVPDQIPVILDTRWGHKGTSSRQYARLAYEILGVDAVTVNPWMGRDSIHPFIDYEERGVFVVAVTPNPGALDLQSLDTGGEPLSVHVARAASIWNENGNIGLVTGTAHLELLKKLREVVPDLPFLVPEIDEESGDSGAVMSVALNNRGEGVIVEVGREILHTQDPDFERGAAQAARAFRDLLNEARMEALEGR